MQGKPQPPTEELARKTAEDVLFVATEAFHDRLGDALGTDEIDQLVEDSVDSLEAEIADALDDRTLRCWECGDKFPAADLVLVPGMGDRSPRHFCESCEEELR